MTSSEGNFEVPGFAPESNPDSRADTPSLRVPGGLGRVCIVGVGLMGGSIGLSLKETGSADSVIGVGRNPRRLETAVAAGAIDSWTTDLEEAAAGADLVILCATIGIIIDQIPSVLASAPPHCAITDIGSTKTAIVQSSGNDGRFVGGHPMCGSEKTGVEAAVSNLYAGATWAVTPTANTNDNALHTVLRLVRATGANALVLDPKQHDAIVAVTSHVPHVLAAALIQVAGLALPSLPYLPRMTAGSFADMTRIAASPPEIWRDVCLTNRAAVLDVLGSYREQLDSLEKAVMMSDAVGIESFFRKGQEQKAAWPPKRSAVAEQPSEG